jgi:hypothetical protein
MESSRPEEATMERDRKPEPQVQPEKKAWVKPAVTVEDVAKVTKSGAGAFVKTDGTTCRS